MRLSTYESFWPFKKSKSIEKRINRINKLNTNYSITVTKSVADLVKKEKDQLASQYCVHFNRKYSTDDLDDSTRYHKTDILYTYYFNDEAWKMNVHSIDFAEAINRAITMFDFTKDTEHLVNMAKSNGLDIGSIVIINTGKYENMSGEVTGFITSVTEMDTTNDTATFLVQLYVELKLSKEINHLYKLASSVTVVTSSDVDKLNMELDELEDYFLALIEDYSKDDLEVNMQKSFDLISNYHMITFKFKAKPDLKKLVDVVDKIKVVNSIFSKKGYTIILDEINRFEIKIYIRPIIK